MSSKDSIGDAVISSAAPLSASEYKSKVEEFNSTAAAYPSDQTIVDLFDLQVARTPDDEAIRLGDRFLSYRELNERANRLAAHLRTLGAGPERLVVLYLEHSIEVVCAILGVLKAGAAYVPVDPASTPKHRLSFILKDISEANGASSAPAVVITNSRFAGEIPAGAAEVVILDEDGSQFAQYPASNAQRAAGPENLAYVIYTSGSTGNPKGVLIEHRSLVNYIWWANQVYSKGERLTWPLFSSLAFDLTVTSIFTPLISGGRIVVYREDPGERGLGILKVIQGPAEIVKLTPSHLAMIRDMDLGATRIRRMIVGGEDFKTELAFAITRKFGRPVELFNEYGPTEATVGCMIHRFAAERDRGITVPVGKPAANSGVYVLDENLRPVSADVTGEMYLAGDGLARGYLNRPDLTEQKFVTVEDFRQAFAGSAPSVSKPQTLRLYKTGDLARWSADAQLEFLGRADFQVKIGGMRIELGEIETRLRSFPGVRDCVVDVVHSGGARAAKPLIYCSRCGVSSDLPGTTYDAEGVCSLCRAYDGYRDKAEAYFKSPEEFQALVAEMKAARRGEYDCLVLFSGGKDSTYMLYKLKDAGLKALAFTLDHGFLSEEAMANIRRVVKMVGVDHVFGTTPHMNEIFVDSLKQFSNVCNGCFKTLYTLAVNLAKEKGIGYIVTGLSRGQFFETRLTEEVFQRKDFDVVKIDDIVLEARKAYHQRPDAVSSHLAVDILKGDGIFDEIQFVDFYRYHSVPLDEMYRDLKARGAWFRPSDTGRSTNCLINDLGIYIHKKQRGFHNYSLPYSWDVRLKQKTRSEAMQELEDEIDEARVQKLMTQIGYAEPPRAEGTEIDRLVAYYVSETPFAVTEVRDYLAQALPEYMVPPYVVWLEKMPLTPNGKIDRKALPAPTYEHMQPAPGFVRPQTETEKALAVIWTELLKVDIIGIDDDFFDLGGHSLLAIRAVPRIRDLFGVDITFQTLFENPTIAGLSRVITAAERSGQVQRIDRRKLASPAPLSFPQEQLWYMNRLAPGSPVYNVADIVEFHGEYSAAAMRTAFQELVQRHEILRTEFSHRDGQSAQIILPEIALPLQELDLSLLPQQEREKEWRRVVQEQVRAPFDLSRAPLFRAIVAHLSGREHRLLVTIHHILVDEWSMEILHQEIQRLYNAIAEGWPSPLPDLPIQYADFACWQREWLQGDVLERQASYWKQELAGAPSILELPTDKARPAVQSFRGATETFRLPAELLEQVKTLGREQQATLFMTLEAAFMALLYRYSGQEDIVVGTPISGRTHGETQNLIGFFLNTVLLRAKFSARENFLSLLQQVRERALGAYAHPDLPFERLVAELAPDRDPSRTPLFQVMFILHNAEGVSQVSKVSGNQELETGTSKFDLTLVLSESEGALDGLFEYNTDLFEPATIRRLASYYARLLEASVARPEQSIAEMPMLPEAERRQLLVDWNNTAVEVPRKDLCLHQLIEEQAARTPDRIALVFEQQEISYGELDRRANQLAQHLKSAGVGPDVLVGIYLQRSIEMLVAMLGVLKAGGAYVPMDPGYPSARIALMIEDARLGFIITTEHVRGALPASPARVMSLDGDAKAIGAQSSSAPAVNAQNKNLAYVIYTSGSTGKPKGVMVEHRHVVNFFAGMDQIIGTGAGTWLAVTSISFDISVLELLWTLARGFQVVIHGEGNTDKIPAEISRHRVTHLQLTPSLLRALVSDPQSLQALAGLEKIFVGGEALPGSLVASLRSVFTGELYNMYGPTETAIWSTVHPVQEERSNIPIGKPIANTQVYVLDSQLRLVPRGATGHLFIGGDGVVRGYWNRPELTAERFVSDPFRPGGRLYRAGDLARFLPDGNLEFLGRSDFQVKIRGFRIELGEIEAALELQPGVDQAVVASREDLAGEQVLAAFFVAKAGASVPADTLRRALEAILPHYMVPSHFVALEKLPLTANGKIDRSALPSIAPAQRRAAGAGEEPRGEFEEILAKAWREALGLDRVSREDNFFQLGGHSLAALKIAFQCQQEFQVDVPLHVFVQYPVLSEQARRLEEMLVEQADASVLESLLDEVIKNRA